MRESRGSSNAHFILLYYIVTLQLNVTLHLRESRGNSNAHARIGAKYAGLRLLGGLWIVPLVCTFIVVMMIMIILDNDDGKHDDDHVYLDFDGNNDNDGDDTVTLLDNTNSP